MVRDLTQKARDVMEVRAGTLIIPLLDFLFPLDFPELDPLALIYSLSWWDSSSSTSDSFSISYIEGKEDSLEGDKYQNFYWIL